MVGQFHHTVSHDGTYKEEAPLHKSHSQYGYEESIKYFTPSIGISEITKLIGKNSLENKNFYILTSLKDMSLYLLNFNKSFEEIKQINRVKIDERIRDILYVKDKNLYLLILENSPSVGVLKFN